MTRVRESTKEYRHGPADDLRSLIVGNGFVGRALAAELRSKGMQVLVASRHRSESVLELELGAHTRAGLARLGAEESVDVIVLAHGPSDPAWCERHEEEARSIHVSAARAAVSTGRRVVLVSSDAVFPGTEAYCDEDSDIGPTHAYGRIKLAAEQVVLARSTSCVVRISAIYGDRREGRRSSFVEECVAALVQRRTFKAPIDQFFTPVALTDAVKILAAVIGYGVTGLVHLGGATRISRFGFACMVAEVMSLPESLVEAVPGAATRWASRPRNSCLRSTDFGKRFGWSYVSTPLKVGIKAAVVGR